MDRTLHNDVPGWPDDLSDGLAARIERLTEPRAAIFTEGFALIGQARWTAPAI